MLRFHMQKFISYNSIFESILFAKYSYHRQSNQFRAEFIESDEENSITYPNKSGIKKKNNNNKIKLKKKPAISIRNEIIELRVRIKLKKKKKRERKLTLRLSNRIKNGY